MSSTSTRSVSFMGRSLALLLFLGFITRGHCMDPVRSSWMTKPTPRPGDWLKRHQGLVAQAHQGGIHVLFVGDSITDGWRNTGLATWNTAFAPLHAANFGISGDGTQNVLW